MPPAIFQVLLITPPLSTAVDAAAILPPLRADAIAAIFATERFFHIQHALMLPDAHTPCR